MSLNKLLPYVFLVVIIGIAFKFFLFNGNLPIPSDTIIGLYHPFRDLYAKEYPRGIPFKNFLITDPVRQQYPWRYLVIDIEKKLGLPLWNPYSMAGMPLLANFQTSAFYPLNILFFILPFSFGWSVLVIFQPLLAGIFLYLYLNNIRINKWASLLGAIVFPLSGFSIAWLEWNTIGHTALWLPLILLSIDKILIGSWSKKFSIFNFQFSISIWLSIFLFSLVSSFFAGHLQTFFYLFLISIAYFFARWIQTGKVKRQFLLFSFCFFLFACITFIQWIPTLQFIGESARSIDQVDWQKDGWFIPFQHLIQFIAPDFFGNPTTLNYWGVWNYAEFIGYVGIFPLIMAIFALFFRRDKKTLFFGIFFFLSLLFALPTIFAKLPFLLQIPFISTAQPTRLLFITDFSLTILAVLGFDYFLRNKKGIIYPLSLIGIVFIGLWWFVITKDISVARQNLILPTGIFLCISFLLIFLWKIKKINKYTTIMICITIVGITVFDLLRFANKFTPFTKNEYLFPQTEIITFLQKNLGQFRIMAADDRILPPNFSTFYKIQSIDGYDPLYLRRYAELVAASERGKPDISSPFGFNRIITPKNYDSKIIDLLGVKYILSLADIDSPKLKKVFQEGETRVYENKNLSPRVFFIENIEQILYSDKQKAIETIFGKNVSLTSTAIVEHDFLGELSDRASFLKQSVGKAEITDYSENRIIIKTENQGDGFLVLTDSFYPTWSATVDGAKTNIYRTDYNFRGIFVPKGNRTIKFYITLL